MTLGEVLTRESLERISNCITSHSGIMGITTFPVGDGLAVCLASQTQAAVIGIPNSRRIPKALTCFLMDPCRVWIVDDEWDSTLRDLIDKQRIEEMSAVHPKSKLVKILAELLELIGWTKIRKPKERKSFWNDFNPQKQDIQWISFQSWAKASITWTIGFGAPCYLALKDTDPTDIWAKLSEYPLKWDRNEHVRDKLDLLWGGTIINRENNTHPHQIP